MDSYNSLSTMKYRFITTSGTGPCIIYITNPHVEGQSQTLYNNIISKEDISDFILCEVIVDDWDTYLTPWSSDIHFGSRSFAGRGKETLNELEGFVIPQIKTAYPEAHSLFIAGYSLAGLFSLWALYELPCLDGAASLSGSLWYPGWESYITNTPIRSDLSVYLSLGNKEHKSGNALMRTIKKMTQLQYDLLINSGIKKLTYETNEGGHFDNVTSRIEKGLLSLICCR